MLRRSDANTAHGDTQLVTDLVGGHALSDARCTVGSNHGFYPTWEAIEIPVDRSEYFPTVTLGFRIMQSFRKMGAIPGLRLRRT